MITKSFNFRLMTESDFPLMFDWLNRPHVAEIWDGPMTQNQVIERYKKNIQDPNIFCFIVEYKNKPIGYIQNYNANLVGDGWWPGEPKGTWGVDQFIGEEDLIGKGLGSLFVQEFSDQMLNSSQVNRVITDPAPQNSKAIRAYEKAGFTKLGIIQTPDGPAQLMEKSRNEKV